MKRKTLIVAGMSLILALCINHSTAQNAAQPAPTPTPGPATLPVAPGPGQPPGQRQPPPMRPRQPRQFVMRAMNDLRMVKAELQRSQDDYAGHKGTALAACEKAMEEFDALIKAMPAPPVPQRMPPPGAAAPAPAPAPTPGAPPADASAPPARPQP